MNRLVYLLGLVMLCFVFLGAGYQTKHYISWNNSAYYSSPSHVLSERSPQGTTRCADNDTVRLLQQQRDDLSARMTELSRQFLQYQCKHQKTGIASHGGWCSNDQSLHKTDAKLASALADLFEGDTVASFGDGLGVYKSLIDKTGKVKRYDSYDGAPFIENYTASQVQFMDLTIPVYGLRVYDWVISLEVAEHIPKKYEQVYLDNVARHAGRGVVLSWAIPKQPGHGHINNQPMEHVIEELDTRGFSHDRGTSEKLRKVCKLWWLKNNLNVYMRRSDHGADVLMT